MYKTGKLFTFEKLTGEDILFLIDRGYTTEDEWQGACDRMNNYPPPWSTNNIEERLNWAEFCLALKEDDFSVGDSFWLGNYHFEVTT